MSSYLETNSKRFLDLIWQETKLFKIITINRKKFLLEKKVFTLLLKPGNQVFHFNTITNIQLNYFNQ